MGKRVKIKYSEEFKKSSAKFAVDSDQSMNQTSRDLGISCSTLHGWINKYYPNRSDHTHKSSNQELINELKKLRKENTKLKQEREILKKATAYFARETM